MSRELSAVEYGIAGALSGIFTRFTCQPFDVIKIRFQNIKMKQGKCSVHSSLKPKDWWQGRWAHSDCLVLMTCSLLLMLMSIYRGRRMLTELYNVKLQTTKRIESKYKSMIQTAWRISKEEGYKSLWKGHVPAQVLSAVYGAAQFTTYEKLTRPWQHHKAAHFAGGAASGVVAVLVSYPFDVIRTRLVAQAEPKVYAGMVDAAKQIVKTEGPSALIRGITPALISTTPLTALVFGFNHVLTSLLLTLTGDVNLGSTLGCGAIAGVCGKAAVYPMDVIKKRMQASGMPEGTSAVPLLRASGIMSAIKGTWKAEKLPGLYKGFTPSLVKAAVSNAVYLSSYNQFRKALASVHSGNV